MLEPWALRQGRVKKWIAGVLFQREMLQRAACIVATSRMEAEGIRLAGVTSPVAIIPNGVDLPPESFRAFGKLRDGGDCRRTALFLSRIHPKKGILDLLTAWKSLAPQDWRLRIVGPSEGGHAGVVSQSIRALGLQPSVSIEKPLWGDDKMRAYAQAELFILPSYSENFGLAIAEALAAGVPVVTTKATPWEELVKERCGWWTGVGAAALTMALSAALKTPTAELATMGQRGRALMERRYSWRVVAEDMMELYRWVLGETKEAPARLMFP
jgi:glycosyltransferase involved in cell wall biosynthesis